MSGPVNSPIGDLDEPTNLPVTTVPEDVLAEEKKLAKYSQTAEFKRLKDYLEARISFFQNYLPDGRPINALDPDVNLSEQWRAANIVIAEFKGVLAEYANAKEVVDAVGRQN